MPKRRLIALVAVAAVVLALVLGWVYSNSASRLQISAATASTTQLDVTADAQGTVAASAANTVTAPTSGVLARIHVADGATVKAGQSLATMDDAPMRNAVAQAEAQLAAARAMPTGTDRLRSARDASIHAAQLSLDLARDNVDRAELKSPSDGTVQYASLSLAPGLPALFTTAPGASVSQGMTLFTVVDPGALRFEAAVDEADIARVEPGQKASVTLDAHPGTTFNGTVEAIRPAASSTSTGGVAFTTTIKVDAGTSRLLTGMTGDARIATASVPNALAVPVQAIVVEGSQHSVWRVADGVAHKVAVGVGPSTDTLTQITSGLAEGDRVATSNTMTLTEGAKVDVRG